MRNDPLALVRGATEFVMMIYGPAVTFAFPDVQVEAYMRSVLHPNLISAVDGSALNWCEQHVLRELMSEDLLFAKIWEPEMTVVNFDDHFRDRMGEVDRGHFEVFAKIWNLRPFDKTKIWGDYKKLPEEIPEFPLIRRVFLGAASAVRTPRLRAFDTNEMRMAKFSMDREEAVDRKNLCNRIPIKLRKKTIRLRKEEYQAWSSVSSVILKTARTRWRRRMSQQTRLLARLKPHRPLWEQIGFCWRRLPEQF